MKFTYPDKKLQRASRYYLSKGPMHNLYKLARIDPEYLSVPSPFSFDDERYLLYPNHGWIEVDYSDILGLDLGKYEDLKIFRLLAANFARVIVRSPRILKDFKDFPHFEKILEFVLIEGRYDYFGLDIESVLMICVQQGALRAGDCGMITSAQQLIKKTLLERMTKKERILEKIKIAFISIITKK